MQVDILEEHGHNSALYGFSLSYKDRAVDPKDWWDFSIDDSDLDGTEFSNPIDNRFAKIKKTAKANAPRGKGHNKFLRQIVLWIDVEAPRYFWSEFDTYKVGVVAQSESTMHTVLKRDLHPTDFEGSDIPIEWIYYLNDNMDRTDIQKAKQIIPEGYLQRRVVTLNYEVLRQIIKQRKGHRLPEWQQFITSCMEQVEHPEYLEDLLKEDLV